MTTDRTDLLLSEWLKRELPPRDFLLGELLSTTSRWIVYGETGVGKTLWALDLIAAVGAGKSFLHWEGSGRRRRIMYLDGEHSCGSSRTVADHSERTAMT